MPDLMQQLRLTLRTLLLCSVLIRHAWSLGITFTSPNGGATLPAGPITVTWADAGGYPSMADLLTFRLELIVGGNSQADSHVLQTIGGADGMIADGSVSGDIAADKAQSIQNGFYLKMTSNSSHGQVINYSNRFTLLNMNGTTDSVYLNGANSDAGDVTNVPSAQYNFNTSPTSSTSATTADSSTTNTAAASQAPPNSPPNSTAGSHEPGPSTGVLAAIIAGSIFALIGAVSIIIWIMFFYRRIHRKRQEKKQHLDSEDGRDDEPVFLGNKTELAAYRSSRSITSPATSPSELHSPHPKYELEGLEKPSEAPGSPMVYELEGDMSCWEAGSGRRSQAWDPTR